MGASIGILVSGDDGLPGEDVGQWVEKKHATLRRYVDISRAVRAKWVGIGKAGATYIDPFCGTGRCKIRETGEWIDGGAVAAWKESQRGGQPFTQIYIGDMDPDRLSACERRLKALGAPVLAIQGPASQTIHQIVANLHQAGLHFAFLDPYNLETLDFNIINVLSKFKRIDILVHLSKMDLQRNVDQYTSGASSPLDAVMPGWRSTVNLAQSKSAIREQLVGHWLDLIRGLGVWPSAKMQLITAAKGQPLYWLILAAKHDLPQSFWKTASNPGGQGELF